MINPRIRVVLSKTKPIATFSCTQRVQEVHTKAEDVCTSCTRGVQENGTIGLVVLQSAVILGLMICFAIHFLCVTIE